MVTAIASPAGRDEKSSMPIHATPASARFDGAICARFQKPRSS